MPDHCVAHPEWAAESASHQKLVTGGTRKSCLGMVPTSWLTMWPDSSAAFPRVSVYWEMLCGDNSKQHDFLLLPLHTPSFVKERQNTSFRFWPITFPKSCLQLAAHFPCVYPIQYLLLSLFLLEDWAGTLSRDGHIITTTAWSAVLNIHGSRTIGCLLAWAPLIKKHKKCLGKSPHSSLKAVGTNLKKKIRT